MSGRVKAFELKSKTSKELLTELDEQKGELATLRVAKVSGGAASKLMKNKVVRKNIARILTVYNQKQKAEARKQAKGKKYTPLDLRPKKTRAMRRSLKTEQKYMKTQKQKTRASNFPMRRFAVAM
uniref:Ribosomal protein L35 n=1 Tax=Pfiesteria piscicida TaxID=71001 RepID=A3E3V3_PFIPI|nr:ribosomal protein L35 [Pfiesteria piscicida]